jgi:hypothetical protein
MMRRGNAIEQEDIHKRLEHDNNDHSWVAPTFSMTYPFCPSCYSYCSQAC